MILKFVGATLINVVLSATFAVADATNYKPWAQTGKVSTEKPKELNDVGITEKNGDQVDPNLVFTDDQGKKVKLGDYFNKGKPLVLSLVYFSCPSLCNLHLNGVNDSIKQFQGDGWTVGKNFELISVSFDSKEDYELAAGKKKAYINEYGKPEAAGGWHFLTGAEEEIKKLTEQTGFKFKWNSEAQEYAHASAAIILTPEGKISRYLHGVYFEPKTFRLSLVEASKGVIGDIIDKFVLYCFKYDPNKKTYAFYAYNFMKMGAGIAALMLFVFLTPNWVRMYREQKQTKKS